MRRLALGFAVVLLAGCTAKPTAGSTVPATSPTPAVAIVSASKPATAAGDQDALLGPGGMSLRQEVGAVMMVGFTGPLNPAVLNDWRQRQFGGLIVLPANHNAQDSNGMRELISSVRAVMAHPLLAATDQKTSTQSAMATLSRGLKAQGFDIDFAHPTDPAGAQAAIAEIHSTGVYVAAQSAGGADAAIMKAAIAAHADLVVVGELSVQSVRSLLGNQGVIISDDLASISRQSGGIPDAAVHFLENGGDMVLLANHLDAADATYDAIHAAVLSGAYPRAQLDASVQKLLNLGLRFMP